MINFSKEMLEALDNPETVKVLTTIDEKGVPHTTFKDSMTILDEKYLAYMELTEFSNTSKNMLRSYWFKKMVTVGIFNAKQGVAYQIKGEPFKFFMEGEVWDRFLEKVWSKMPDTDPTGVWLIVPREIINQDFKVRRGEIAKTRPEFWRRFFGHEIGSFG